MKEQFSETFTHSYTDFLQDRLNFVHAKIYKSKAFKNLEKARENAEKELRAALGEEGWKAYQEWYLDNEQIFSSEEGLRDDELYLQGFQDGQTFAVLMNGEEPFFAEYYEDIAEDVKKNKQQRKAAKILLRRGCY